MTGYNKLRFANRLRDLRVSRGYTQRDLAALANMDRSYYDDLERGIKDPTLTYLDKLAGALNLTADELIKDDVSKAGDDVLVQHSMDAPRDLVRAGISFDHVLLERIDQRATSMGLTRTAFVVNAVAEKLLQLERVEK